MINLYYTYQRIKIQDNGQPYTREDGSFDYFLETRSIEDIAGFADADYKTGVLYLYTNDEEIRTKETRLVHLNAINKIREEAETKTVLGGDGED